MKKSVVLTLLAIYVLSICVVGYFGLKVRIYRPTVYAEKVTITGVKDAKTGEDYTGKIKETTDSEGKKIRYVRINSHDDMTITLVVEIGPDNTTNRDLMVAFSLQGVCERVENENTTGSGITQEITIKFLTNRDTTITVKAKDSPSVLDEIKISFKNI